MGQLFMDQFTYLHFAFGIVAYFWRVGLWPWLICHTFFEFAENTPIGMKINNKWLKGVWPGGKPRRDSTLNIIGDTVGAVLGWVSAWALDSLGSRLEWYDRFIPT